MWFWRRYFFSFSVLTVSFGLGLDLDSNLFGLGLDTDSNLFGLGLDSDSNLFGLGLVLDSTKVDLTTALVPTPVSNYNVNMSIMTKQKLSLVCVVFIFQSNHTGIWLEVDRDPLFKGVSAHFLGVHQGSYSSIDTYSNEPH